MISNNEKKRPVKITIILPAYNQGRYVDEAVESLKRQTYQDFEIVLLDDGSNDGVTPQKLDRLRYDKIKSKHLYKKNVGASTRYNPFLREARGEYVMILCGDDTLEPTFLEECVVFLDKNREFAAVSPWIRYFGEFEGIRKFDQKKITLETIILGDASYLGSCMMRKKAIDDITLDGMKRQADFDRWISFLENGWRLGVINEPLFNYRQVSTSQWHTNTIDMELEVKEFIYDKHRDTFLKYSKELYLNGIRQLWESRDTMSKVIADKDAAIERLQKSCEQLEAIKASRSWRMLARLHAMLHGIKKLFS